MKNRYAIVAMTAVTLLLGSPVFAHQEQALTVRAFEAVPCAAVVTPAVASQVQMPGLNSSTDKAALLSQIKHDSLQALQQSTSRILLLRQTSQSVKLPASKPLQASL